MQREAEGAAHAERGAREMEESLDFYLKFIHFSTHLEKIFIKSFLWVKY